MDAMSEPAKRRMTADEFIAWAVTQPRRYELQDGEVLPLAPERIGHARMKHRIARLLEDAVLANGIIGEVLPDGVSVRVSQDTVYEPDATLRLGPPLPNEQIEFIDPILVVEVLSPSTGDIDATTKLAGYFRLPSLRHYLVVDARRRVAVHHRRGEDGTIITRILGDGPLRLDPPGIVLESLFAPPP